MKDIGLIFILLLGFGCSSREAGDQDSLNDSIEEEPERPVDSIMIASFRAFELGQDINSFIVELSNPYSDTIVLDDEYYIFEIDSDTLLLREAHPRIIIEPNSSYSFDGTFGMDSIWYNKKTTYLFTFPGKNKERDVIFYYKNPYLGHYNKLNGMYCGIPDEIILPVSLIPDPDYISNAADPAMEIDSAMTEPEMVIDSAGIEM